MAREEWIITPGQSRIIDLDGVERLKLGLIRGHVDVIGHDEPTARVEISEVTGKDLTVTFDAGRLTIDHPQISWDNFLGAFHGFRGKASAQVSVLVPREIALNFGVVSAEGFVSGLIGPASVSTVNGTVLVDDCRGDLQLNAVNGELIARAHRGGVVAHTVSGEITVSGAVTSLTMDSVSGDLFADLEGAPERLRANTVSGDVTLRLTSGVVLDYRINTVSGRVQLDESEFRGVKGGFSGTWPSSIPGAPRTELKVNTVSGNIVALHRATAEAQR